MSKPKVEVTFENVTITIRATDPVAAYNRLCNILEQGAAPGELEYTTDSFSVLDPPADAPWPDEGDTILLWPDEASSQESST